MPPRIKLPQIPANSAPHKSISPIILPVFSFIVFFIGATEFMLSPMLKPLTEAFNTTMEKATWLISGYAFAYALAAPILGWLSDRINRHKLFLISLLFLSFDGLALTIAPNLEIAIGLRIFGGIASAALVPLIFSLIADIFPPHKQAPAMGIVMLGMTAGIAGGPIFAGVLTEAFNWQLPFWVSALGYLLLYFLSRNVISIPIQSNTRNKYQALAFQWIRQGNVMRPLIAKGLWNGTAVSSFILSGEVLRQYYDLTTGAIGMSVSVFGVGLGFGNLATRFVKYLDISNERILLLAIVFIFVTSTIFMLMPISLFFSLACLTLWGCSLGMAAPISTSILASRAKHDKGQVLAVSESLNNLTILFLLPIYTLLLTQYGAAIAVILPGIGFIIGIWLICKDNISDTVTK
ncbi:drug-export protein [Xenorhabdus mauleonii]|uniref:Drug-export protein n=1 Tax=Xenorhabdus mauleonii TaxID=351675 RepID=A0A1I3M0J9_9GAMM|nr:MFS transporter [Xenorhabdus mauleonii]PHM45364.1 drug-export protein [Xenorhabdus mauleonii]SFI90571.1 Predicted arabinose efflux permease, MFS family [Xenorhabdus mauleonii]